MKNEKTTTYSDNNKTTIYGVSEKLTKETVHNLKAGDSIVLNNKEYKIIEIISESTGEAVIYKIEDNQQKIYALKLYFEFINPENEPNTEALLRIKNIEDVDILNLIDYGTGINKYKNKYCFEISDFAHGADLLSTENLKNKYTPDFVEKGLIPQIFLGIEKLHENRIYHCDLKPQNIFYLDENQTEIVIGDYGSAKTFEFDSEKSSRKTTTIKGTDFYLPPEQARGFISKKNDYYSFGMILLHLFYPEKLLLNENDDRNLNRAKLKQIIERQFEAKPIIDYNPTYERINKLIEGLTLVDFNLRWGKEQVEQWIKGEKVNVTYKKIQSDNRLIFGKYTINTPEDLRDYIFGDENWYEDMVEDPDNWDDFTDRVIALHKGDKRKRSALNRIVKNYSQDGKDFVAEAIIRFLIPEHPVSIGMKYYQLIEITDLSEFTAKIFTNIIFELWDNSTDSDIKLYLFRYEFALRQLKYKQTEVLELLQLLYKELNTKGEIRPDFYSYRIYAYTSVSKKTLNNLKQFLFEYLPAETELDFTELSLKNKLKYKLRISLSNYFLKLGIEHKLIKDIYATKVHKEHSQHSTYSAGEIIYTDYPGNYINENEFFVKTFDILTNRICNIHKVSAENLDESYLGLFKSNFKNAYKELFQNLIKSNSILQNKLNKKIKRKNPVKKDLKEIKSIINNKTYHKIETGHYLINKVRKYNKNQIKQEKVKINYIKAVKKQSNAEIYYKIDNIIRLIMIFLVKYIAFILIALGFLFFVAFAMTHSDGSGR